MSVKSFFSQYKDALNKLKQQKDQQQQKYEEIKENGTILRRSSNYCYQASTIAAKNTGRNETILHIEESPKKHEDNILGDDDSESIDDDSASSSSNSYKLSSTDKILMKTAGRSSELTLKTFAMNSKIMDGCWKESCNCQGTTYPGRCLQSVTIDQIQIERESLFNEIHLAPPTTSERGKRLSDIFKDRTKKSGSEIHVELKSSTIKVCENAYFVILGFCGALNDRKPKLWQRLKAPANSLVRRKGDDAMKVKICPKEEHFISWLRISAMIRSDTSVNANQENRYVLPYNTLAEVWRAYYSESVKIKKMNPNNVASFRTCKRAWQKQEKDSTRQEHFVLYRTKGSFATCSCCNITNNYLVHSDKFNFSEHDRNILRAYRDKHLEQQEAARQHAEKIRNDCKTKFDDKGNPLAAMMWADAMSDWAGNTPSILFLGRRNKNDTGIFRNRVMGVEITCGPVDLWILYHADELVKGGANFMIEVQRLAIHELRKRLKQHGLDMPRILHLQYDNCSENKNKFMFMYLSLLVELAHFDKIYVGFLVVNHTHAPIDQKYSAIKSRLRRAQFIASPEALWVLLQAKDESQQSESKYVSPDAQYRVSVVHDYKSALDPYFDRCIKNYGTPFNFQIFCIGGVAVVQAQMFVGGEWYPKIPSSFQKAMDPEGVISQAVYEFPTIPLASVGGRRVMYETINITKDLSANDLMKMDLHEFTQIANLNRMLPVLQTIENKAAVEQMYVFEAEERLIEDSSVIISDAEAAVALAIEKDFGAEENEAARSFNNGEKMKAKDVRSAELLMANTMASSNTCSEGFLTFISSKARATLPALSTVKPLRMSPFCTVSTSSNSQQRNLGYERSTIDVEDTDEEDVLAVISDTRLESANKEDNAGVSPEVLTSKREHNTIIRPTPAFVNSVSSAKTAAIQALDRLDPKNQQFTLVTDAGDNPGCTTNHERFSSYTKKLVYPSDLRYYNDHKTVEAQAKLYHINEIAYEEDIEPSGDGFEWFISIAMTESEIALRDELQCKRADSAALIVKMCKAIFDTERLKEYDEIIQRVTNEARRKKDLQEMEKRARKDVSEKLRKERIQATDEEKLKKLASRNKKAEDRILSILNKESQPAENLPVAQSSEKGSKRRAVKRTTETTEILPSQIQDSEMQACTNEELFRKQQEEQAKQFGETDTVPYVAIITENSMTYSYSSQQHLLLTLPTGKIPQALVKTTLKSMIAELTIAVAKAEVEDEPVLLAKRRRVFILDPIELTTDRLVRELCETNYYSAYLSCLFSTFKLSATDEVQLNETTARKALIRNYCVAMKEMYGKGSLKDYLETLKSLKFKEI